MSAVRMALGLDNAVHEAEHLVLSTAQLAAYQLELQCKLADLADPAIAEMATIQFIRGEISALTLIINNSVSALTVLTTEENTGE